MRACMPGGMQLTLGIMGVDTEDKAAGRKGRGGQRTTDEDRFIDGMKMLFASTLIDDVYASLGTVVIKAQDDYGQCGGMHHKVQQGAPTGCGDGDPRAEEAAQVLGGGHQAGAPCQGCERGRLLRRGRSGIVSRPRLEVAAGLE